MFVVTEADATAIRAAYEQRGEFAATVELRRLFPGITDNAQAQECAGHRRLAATAAGETAAQTAAVTPGPMTRASCRTGRVAQRRPKARPPSAHSTTRWTRGEIRRVRVIQVTAT